MRVKSPDGRRKTQRSAGGGRAGRWSCRCTATSRRRPGRRRRPRPGLQVGYVQTGGGALPGSLSRDVAELRERGLLCGHITAAPAYGGEHEALSTVGALDAADRLGWDAALVGPGPGIIGSDTEFGHGGMAALDSAHAALSLRLPTLLSPRLSSSDPRERHRRRQPPHLHRARTAPGPGRRRRPRGRGLDRRRARRGPRQPPPPPRPRRPRRLRRPRASRPRTMGRSLAEDPLFFAAPLAAGRLLGG